MIRKRRCGGGVGDGRWEVEVPEDAAVEVVFSDVDGL